MHEILDTPLYFGTKCNIRYMSCVKNFLVNVKSFSLQLKPLAKNDIKIFVRAKAVTIGIFQTLVK